MTNLTILNNRETFLKYSTDPIYLIILNKYFDHLEANSIELGDRSFYDFLYKGSSYEPYVRLKSVGENGTLSYINMIAADFDVEVEYTYESAFELGRSSLNSPDFMSDNLFRKNSFTITSYANAVRMSEFVDFFNKYIKPAGIKTELIVRQ